MAEPNLGIRMTCSVCQRSFWSEDGISICSPNCEYEVTCCCGNYKDPQEAVCYNCNSLHNYNEKDYL